MGLQTQTETEIQTGTPKLGHETGTPNVNKNRDSETGTPKLGLKNWDTNLGLQNRNVNVNGNTNVNVNVNENGNRNGNENVNANVNGNGIVNVKWDSKLTIGIKPRLKNIITKQT